MDFETLPCLPPDQLDELLRAGAEAWRDFLVGHGHLFHGFIPADHRDAYEELRRLRAGANSFLELGSGVGVITILADLLGFDAFGIEIEPELLDYSLELAERFGSRATFIEGSFVPHDFRDEISLLDADFLTITDGPDAYIEMGMEIGDFDLVYAYPWPGEEEWMAELVRREAGPRTSLMTYSVSEGYKVGLAST